MHFFGLYGTLSFMLGFATSVYLVVSKLIDKEFSLTNRPFFYMALTFMIIGVQLFVTGFIAELVTRNAAERNVYLIDEKLGIKG